MCGILGCVYKDYDANARAKFVQSLQLLAHRGPDFQDFVQSDNLFLGHTRLSILDLDMRSNQPMSYKDKYTLIFNGEIYNYKELKEELYHQGYRFQTQGDTEVLLCAYDFWGEACVEHCNGMWAFALLDKVKKQIFCSRDRFGEKPFFYYEDTQKLVFASEIKAILPYLKERRANIPAMIPFIVRQNVDCYLNETFFKGIYRLNPSENLVIDLNTLSLSKTSYYTINKQEISSPNPALKVREILEDSIRLRLRSDVKIGGCLSGGLDSSCLNALIAKSYSNPKDFLAIHAKSSLQDNDESAYAKEVAKHLGIELCVIEPSKKEFLESLEQVIRVQDEPFGSTSIYMQYFVMQKARELGIKVMFDGQGADEIFLGYEHYFQYIYKTFKDANKEEEFFKDLKNFRYSKEMIKESLERVENVRAAFDRAKMGGVREKYLDFAQFKEIYNYTSFYAFNVREIYKNNLQSLLRFEDRDSMAFGVESRLPYLDYRLVDYVLALPISVKFQKGYLKFLLREACKDILPQNILWRYNKLGFESPQKLWLQEDKEMLEAINQSKLLKEIFTTITIKEKGYLWRLFNIAKWEEIYQVEL
ncbi:asparagine synthase (glutamine-hydrolyzing) [Helicobacter turcicus]|uniref:asparagine synthase (glutamine-hydrolyzing) n=1 Tax=Helicobacter turcicus TaxID=2867412 RepID=A0ABS7JQ73_9HELI|nr:asparagine synthase (glutamine-hydrolyzing) [Helicobacter turcicus]MBX7491560.1 asparagine synthase (glutamine-hydrolyzing) [Helicobacter turcicus]MBX7546413.1 asparagine synthase (glutamine-hydrolyzing) [Helicobacter turcicus]